MASDAPPLPLLELPDPCLLAVLRCCAADDASTLFSTARAHSRLHQAAVPALSSIAIADAQQHKLDSLLLYLAKHGQRVCSIKLQGQHSARPTLHQLSYSTMQQLTSLSLSTLHVQLQPGNWHVGVLLAGAPLQQLRLARCNLLDGEGALGAALTQLPSLQHLSFCGIPFDPSNDLTDEEWDEETMDFPCEALHALPAQLTHLELLDCEFLNPTGLQHLQRLTRLQDLRLRPLLLFGDVLLTTGTMSALRQLTRLDLQEHPTGEASLRVEPAMLAGLTQLQHLALVQCRIAGGAAGVAQLLSHLQPLQQLTYLDLSCSMHEIVTPAAAYSALTASSRLQHLDISHNKLPTGVWQHIFPAGRSLPQLQLLDVNSNLATYGFAAVVPEGSRLVSCCPGLQTLHVHCLRCSAELLAPLTGLSCLQELGASGPVLSAQAVQAVYQLSALQRLELPDVRAVANTASDADLVVQMSQLQHLTWLRYYPEDRRGGWVVFNNEGPGDEPVWRQVQQYHLKPPSDSGSADSDSEADSEVESDPESESGSEFESDPE